MIYSRGGSKRLAQVRRTGRRQKGGIREEEAVVRHANEGNGHSPVPDKKALRSREGDTQPAELWTDIFRLFAETADGVWVSGPSGEILFWNRAAETILGYSAQQVVGRVCREVFDGRDINGNQICRWPCPIKTVLHGGDLMQHFDMATRTKTGKPLWIDVSCIAVPSDDDRPPATVHLFRDVTAAHQLEVLVRQQLAQTQLAVGEETPPPIGELTQREMQIVTLMRTGATTAAIADQLFISKTTVRNHIQNIFSKLKVHNRLEAVAYVNQIARRGATVHTEAGPVPGATKEVTQAANSRDRKD